MTKSLLLNPSFRRTLITLSLPIAFQNLINTTLNAIDSVMIGALGSNEIAAVGFANQIFLILWTMLFGICTACGIFISQFYGKGDEENIRKSVSINIVGSLVITIIFTLLAMLTPQMLIGLFTHDQTVIGLGSSYMTFVALSYIPMGITFAFSFALRAVGKPQIPLIISILSLFINAFFNYVFIFGKFGAPALGVAGAAIGTVIARGVEFLLVISITYAKVDILRVKLRHFTSISKDFLVKFLKTAAPVICNETMWSIGTAAYSAVFGRLSTDAVAAINITKVLENMMLVFFQGVGNAAGIMVGRKIGENKNEDAIRYANTFTYAVPIFSLIFSGLMLAARPLFLSLYNVDSGIIALTNSLILITALYLPFRALNYVQIVGTLRSGGDTVICLLIDTLGIWLLSLPLTFLTGIVLGWDVRIVYACSLLEEAVKFFIVIWRIRSKKWIRNLVHDM